jgi:hypothetical protein
LPEASRPGFLDGSFLRLPIQVAFMQTPALALTHPSGLQIVTESGTIETAFRADGREPPHAQHTP